MYFQESMNNKRINKIVILRLTSFELNIKFSISPVCNLYSPVRLDLHATDSTQSCCSLLITMATQHVTRRCHGYQGGRRSPARQIISMVIASDHCHGFRVSSLPGLPRQVIAMVTASGHCHGYASDRCHGYRVRSLPWLQRQIVAMVTA